MCSDVDSIHITFISTLVFVPERLDNLFIAKSDKLLNESVPFSPLSMMILIGQPGCHYIVRLSRLVDIWFVLACLFTWIHFSQESGLP